MREYAKKIIGVLYECEASAMHSFVKEKPLAKVNPGKTVTFSLQAVDCQGATLTHGGDAVTAQWSTSTIPAACARPQSEITVTDHDNGCYTIKCTPHMMGQCGLDVMINGQRVPAHLVIQCPELLWQFDSLNCQLGNTITPDGHMVTKTDGRSTGSAV